MTKAQGETYAKRALNALEHIKDWADTIAPPEKPASTVAEEYARRVSDFCGGVLEECRRDGGETSTPGDSGSATE